MGFALIWHIWWMAVAGLAGIVSTALVHAWRVDGEIEIPVETLAALERARSNGEQPYERSRHDGHARIFG
jgi:cytochrome o ubiquinol oxidase subunit 1